ncbi:MAG: radical SAM protein [Bacillota bacterium]
MTKGRIQSIQSFSTVDGPGTRCVTFLQGCPAGCIFCHNPDAWDFASGKETGVEELLRRLERFRPFLRSPGLTVSGGEPLVQPEFTFNLLISARKKGWHTALDSSGWGPGEVFAKIAGIADLVMLSIKHPLDPGKLSRFKPEQLKEILGQLKRLPVPLWLRYVLIPGWSDEPEALRALGKIAAGLPRLEKIEILPYHSLARCKWQKLGWDSPLFYEKNLTATEEEIRRAEEMAGVK